MTLTAKAERVAGLLAAEWRATEATITEIESELPYPLTRVAEDIRAALARKSFHDRITEHLSAECRVASCTWSPAPWRATAGSRLRARTWLATVYCSRATRCELARHRSSPR